MDVKGMEGQIMASMQNTDVKEKMKELYSRGAVGTENLYVDVGYFMRMRFWGTINGGKVARQIRCASTFQESQAIYNYIMEMMNVYIRNDGNKTTTENVNNMIFNRNMIKKNYVDHPQRFVEKLRLCLEREKEILRNNGIVLSQTELDLGNGESLFEQDEMKSPSMLEEMNLLPETSDLGGISSVTFDSAFIEDLQKDFNNLESCWQYKISLENDHKEKIRMMSSASRYVLHEIEDLSHRKQLQEQLYAVKLSDLLKKLRKSVEQLAHLRETYRKYQGRMEVKLLPKEEIEPQLTIVFNRFAGFLNRLYEGHNIRDSKLDETIKDFMEMSVVVQEHPRDFVFVDNEKKGAKSKEEDGGAGKSKAAPKTYCTKKKESISTKIEILGWKHLSKFFVKEQSITLKSEDGIDCGKLSVPNPEWKESEATFSDIKIQGYERRGCSNINNQFVRLHFLIKVSCFDREFKMEITSLPFFLCTGAVQELELIGSRMWYIGSNDNMYYDCHLQDELPQGTVLDILDQRIQSIGNQRGRCLTQNAKQFLQDMIPGSIKGQKRKNISLHSLVKNKGKKDGKNPTEKNFSFFTWFYALVNTIETYLLQPWNDGVIYDLMTKEDAEQYLYSDAVKLHTALIRPARSSVLKPNCTDAQVKVAVEIKRRINGEDKVQVVNLDINYIMENTLFGALESIMEENEDVSVIKYILTPTGTLHLEALKKYNNNGKSPVQEYHDTVVRRVANLKLQDCDKTSSIPPSKIVKYDQDDNSPRKRKSSRQSCLNVSCANPTAATSSSMIDSPVSLCDSNFGTHKNDLRSPGVASTHDSNYSGSPKQLESLDCFETFEVKQEIIDGSSQSPKQDECWRNFGGNIKVDVSNIGENKVLSAAASVPNGVQPTQQLNMTASYNVNYALQDQPSGFAEMQTQQGMESYNGYNTPLSNGPIDFILEFIQNEPHCPIPTTSNGEVNMIAEMLQSSAEKLTSHSMCH